jgi:hypothetical protein
MPGLEVVAFENVERCCISRVNLLSDVCRLHGGV